jgi:outer membrane lipoprotein SlyB
MKKGLISLVCLLAIMAAAVPAGAQTRVRRYNNNQVYRDYRYRDQTYRDNRYHNYERRNRSVWDRSRDKITTAAGAGGGALLGAMIGGKKGAIIGAIAGGGAAAVYTYGIRDKDRRRYRRN